MATKLTWTVEDLEQLEDDGLFYEIDEGELITLSPGNRTQGRIEQRLNFRLARYLDTHAVGELFPSDVSFVLQKNPTIVRSPDIAFVRAARDLGNPDKFIEGAPDLAIEIISPSERPSAIKRKIGQYLEHGAAVVWVVYFNPEEMHIYDSTGERVLRTGDVLEVPALLPGFSLPLAEIFSA